MSEVLYQVWMVVMVVVFFLIGRNMNTEGRWSWRFGLLVSIGPAVLLWLLLQPGSNMSDEAIWDGPDLTKAQMDKAMMNYHATWAVRAFASFLGAFFAPKPASKSGG